MGRKVLLVALFLTTCACVSSSPLTPTTGPWTFSGTIFRLDGIQVGHPIAAAKLTIVSGVNSSATTTTDADGRYVFPSLDGGKFDLTISASGYATATPVVILDRDMQVDFVLSPK